MAVLDSTVDEKGLVHNQVMETDQNGHTPDHIEYDATNGSCIDLIIKNVITNDIEVIDHFHFFDKLNFKELYNYSSKDRILLVIYSYANMVH